MYMHKVYPKLVGLNSSTLNIFLHSIILQTEAIDVDIDEILDMDTDDIRRSYLFVSISEIQ